jgi:hypothetical protein
MRIRIKLWTSAGLVSVGIGLAWLTLWSYFVHRNSVDWIANELRAPPGARLLTLAGAVTLVVTGIVMLIGKLTKRSRHDRR